MDTGKAAAAVTGGYLLGRFRKARWALVLAGAVAGRQIRSNGGKGAASGLLKSADVGKLTEGLRGQIASAGKAAAVAATARKMDALTDRLAGRAEALRAGPGGSDEDEESEEPEEAEAEQDEDEEPEDEQEEEQEDEQEEEQEEPGGGTRAGARKSRTTSREGAKKTAAPAKKQGSGGTARKKASGSRPSGSAAKKKAASGSETRKRTARKTSASSRAGGRGKE